MKMTQVTKPYEVERDWILIDAEGQTFGRILTQAATYLRGKHKPSFTPNVDGGDYVVIINAKREPIGLVDSQDLPKLKAV
jgi:large subunit ribosomal protein L13